MARILIPTTDSEGNQITFESSDHEMNELIESYPHIQGFLQENGFIQSKPTVTKTYGRGRPQRPPIQFDGKTCPKCQGGVWDNRQKIINGEFGPKSPDFSCKNKSCGWAIWKGQYILGDTSKPVAVEGDTDEQF